MKYESNMAASSQEFTAINTPLQNGRARPQITTNGCVLRSCGMFWLELEMQQPPHLGIEDKQTSL